MSFDLFKLNEYKEQWKSDPSGFMTEMLGTRIPIHQKSMIDAIIQFDDVTIKSANGVGKSYTFAALALWFLFCYYVNDDDNVIVLLTAPTFSQVRENIYNPIRSFIDKIDDKLKKEFEKLPAEKKALFNNEAPKFVPKLTEDKKQAEVRVGRKNYILGVSTDSENSNVGKHGTYVLCIFDEAQGIDDRKMSDFRGITTSGLIVKKVMIGNTTLPQGLTGPFFRSFQKASEWKQLSISCFDTPNFILPNIKKEDFTKEESDPLYWRNKLDRYCKTNYYKAKKENKEPQWKLDVKQALMPWSKYLINPIEAYKIFADNGYSLDSYEFRTRCLAEFPPDDSNSVFPQDWINSSFLNYNNDSLYQPGEIVMGLDIAQGTNSAGSDKSAVVIRDGNKVLFAQTFNLELFELLEKIEELFKEYNCEKINIETDGVGRDKYLLLEQRGLPVVAIQSGGGVGDQNSEFVLDKEKQDRLKKEFCGKRDEIWWNLRNLLNPYRDKIEETKDQHSILLPNIESLRQEMSAATFKRNDKSKIKVSSRDEIKDKIGRSPDLLTAVIMAFAETGDGFYLNCNFGAINVAPCIRRPGT